MVQKQSIGVDYFADNVYQATQVNPIWTTAQFQFWSQLGMIAGVTNLGYKTLSIYSWTSRKFEITESTLDALGYKIDGDIRFLPLASDFAAQRLDLSGNVDQLRAIVKAHNAGNDALLRYEINVLEGKLLPYGNIKIVPK